MVSLSFFFAPNPNKNDISCIVGWYKNATVYRNWLVDSRNNYRGEQPYSFIVNPSDAFLLNVKNRNTQIITSGYARANGISGRYPGMSNVFFGESNPKYVNSIIKKLKNLKKYAM